ncbi:MAG: alkaline phosphatase D family protein [Deferribacteres bacterium]|nr:alkaline phosphatase D family protein [Deferribacteres bacterium]
MFAQHRINTFEQKRTTLLNIVFSLFLFIPTLLLAQPQITHGPVVGAVTESSARIVVRLSNQASVQFQLASDAAFGNPISSSTTVAEADSDFFAIVSVMGLQADTRYFYRAVIDGAPQATAGSFRTFPPPGAASTFMFAFGACQQAFSDPGSNIGRVWPLIVQDQPRFFLQVGDWSYPDTTKNFSIDYSRVQSNYRSKYAPDYPMSELFKIAPIDYVYDDHDFSEDNADRLSPGAANAVRGYRAMFPHYPLANASNGIWHKFSFGNADFFIVDNRSQRAPNDEAFQRSAERHLLFRPDSAHLILQANPGIDGELQMDWLIRELKESTATWKFIGSGTAFNPTFFRTVIEYALYLESAGFQLPISLSSIAKAAADGWAGFPASVARLVKAVSESGVENIIWLSGDTHTGAIDDGSNSIFPEVMAGGLDRSNSRILALADLFGVSAWNQGGQNSETNNFNSHYGRITVFGEDSVRMELVDEYGALLARYTHLPGNRISPVRLVAAPPIINLGEVAIGEASRDALLLFNVAADDAVISDISSSDPQFSVSLREARLAAMDTALVIEVRFAPQQTGEFNARLVIESNDPNSPTEIALSGRGLFVATGIADAADTPPQSFALLQNYPNPFNAGTRIDYVLPRAALLKLTIYNDAGQQIRSYAIPQQPPGSHSIAWDGLDSAGRMVPSGMYVYRLEARTTAGEMLFANSKKMLLLK